MMVCPICEGECYLGSEVCYSCKGTGEVVKPDDDSKDGRKNKGVPNEKLYH